MEKPTTDYAASYRKDIESGFPSFIVRSHAERQLVALRILPEGTDDKDIAIRDITAFLEETKDA